MDLTKEQLAIANAVTYFITSLKSRLPIVDPIKKSSVSYEFHVTAEQVRRLLFTSAPKCTANFCVFADIECVKTKAYRQVIFYLRRAEFIESLVNQTFNKDPHFVFKIQMSVFYSPLAESCTLNFWLSQQ